MNAQVPMMTKLLIALTTGISKNFTRGSMTQK